MRSHDRRATKRGLMLSTSSWWEMLVRNFTFMLGRMSNRLAFEMTKDSRILRPIKWPVRKSAPFIRGTFFPPVVQSPDGKDALLDEMIGDRFALISREPVGGESVDWLHSVLGGTSLTIGKDVDSANGKLAQYFIDNKVEVILVRPDFTSMTRVVMQARFVAHCAHSWPPI